MRTKKKSVIAIPKSGSEEKYLQNYYLLSAHGGRLYLFQNYPCGIINNKGVDIRPFIPRATRPVKKKFENGIKSTFLKMDQPRLLISKTHNDAVLNGIVEQLNTTSGIENVSANSKVGLVIIENADIFTATKYKAESFLKWLQPISEAGAKFIIHLSNPDNRNIDLIEKKLGAITSHFGLSILHSNEHVKNMWSFYRAQHGNNLDEYNWDGGGLYEHRPKHSFYKKLDPGNLDIHFNKIRELNGFLKQNEIENRKQYYYLLSLIYKLHKISIDPTWYRTKYFYKAWNGVRTIRIETVIDDFKAVAKSEKTQSRQLNDIVNQVEGMCIDLFSRMRRSNHEVVPENSKYGSLLKFIIDWDPLKKLLICLNDSTEKNWLVNQSAEFIELSKNKKIDVTSLPILSKSNLDRSEYNVLFTGSLPPQFIPELLQPYQSMHFICYSGEEEKLLDEALSILEYANLNSEKKSVDSLRKILNTLEWPLEDPIIKDFDKRVSELVKEPSKDAPDKKPDSKIDEIVQKDIRDIIGTVGRNLTKLADENAAIDEKILEETGPQNLDAKDLLTVEAEELSSGEVRKLDLVLTTIYTYFEDDSIEDCKGRYPDELKPGNLLVLPLGETRKGFLDMIMQILGEDDEISKDLVAEWNTVVRKTFTDLYQFYDVAYEKYRELGGKRKLVTMKNWVDGRVFGPQQQEDLQILAIMTGDDELIGHIPSIFAEIEKWRRLRRQAGKKIPKVVRAIVENTVDPVSLDFEESVINEMIGKSIYRIL